MTKQTPPSHIGHRQRLKQRLHAVGVDSFLDHEFLELLLTYSIARKDTKPIAWALLKRFGSMAGVLDAPVSALTDVPGVGESTAQFLQLVRATFKRYTRARVPKRIEMKSPHDVLEYCKASLVGKQEEFVEVICLSVRCRLISARIVATGSISQIYIEPKQIVSYAMAEQASSIIIVHNHPSGDPNPSAQDIAWTLQTKEAAWLFNIKVLDHLIIAKDGYYSFKGNGYLNYPDEK